MSHLLDSPNCCDTVGLTIQYCAGSGPSDFAPIGSETWGPNPPPQIN